MQKQERFTNHDERKNMIIELNETMTLYTDIIFRSVEMVYVGAGGFSTVYSIHDNYDEYNKRILNNVQQPD